MASKISLKYFSVWGVLSLIILAALIVCRPNLPSFSVAILVQDDGAQQGDAHLLQDNGYGYGYADDQSTAVPLRSDQKQADDHFHDKPSPFYFGVPKFRAATGVRVEIDAARCPNEATLYLRSSNDVTRLVPLQKMDGTECLLAPSGGLLDLTPFLIYFHPLKFLIQLLIALGLAKLMLFAMAEAKKIKRNPDAIMQNVFLRRFAVCFVVFFAWYLLWVAGGWPGYFGEDSFPPMEQVTRMHLTSWFSIIYPAIIFAIQQIAGSFAAIGIFVAALTAALVALCFAAASRYRVPPMLMLIILSFFFLSPAVLAYLSFVTRDVISALDSCALLIFTFFTVFEIRYRRKHLTHTNLVIFLSLAFLSAAIRLENAVLVAACTGVLFAFAAPDRAKLKRPFAVFAFVILCWHVIVTPLVTGESIELRNGYAINPMLNPMGGLIHEGYATPTPNEDMETVSSVVDPKIYRERWHVYGLDYMKWPTTATTEQVQGFRGVLMRAIIHNPQVYFGDRFKLFAAIIGSPNTWYFTDYSQGGRIGDLKNYQVYRDKPSRLFDVMKDYLWEPIVAWRTGDSLLCYAWSAWVQLIIVMLVFGCRTWLPVAGWVAGCMMARLVCLLFLAPASHFFYVYDLVLFGAWLPALAFIEWQERRR